MLEYAEEKILLHINPKDILVLENWEVVGKIEDPIHGNT